MDVYVLDAYALVALESLCASDRDVRACLNTMTTYVQAGVLTFPDRVVKQCRSVDSNSMGYMWAHACSGHRQEHGPSDSAIGSVMANHPELMPEEQDPKAKDKNADATPVDVLALAITLQDQGHTATIISGELPSYANRQPLATVAPKFGVAVMGLAAYMHAEGLSQHLAA